jgi:hypothetical protein
MSLENVAIHNVGALEDVPGYAGKGLMRIPAAVRNQMNERARFVAMDSVGCEIRFVTDAQTVDVTLSHTKPEFLETGEVRVFRGNVECSRTALQPGTVQRIRLVEPASFSQVDRDKLQMGGFASNVWRVLMGRGACAIFQGIETHGHQIRPPRPEELPSVKWLAYGSSITNSHLDGYPHVAARILRVEVENKGLSGACQCEPVLADWLADECDWDIITCEMGVNMRGCFTPEAFRERVTYLLTRLTNAHPDKPVVAISVFPNAMSAGWGNDANNTAASHELAYNEIVPEVVKEIGAKNLHFISGSDILTDFTGLGGDLLHPNVYGHAIMGANLAERLKPILGRQ